MGGARGAWEVGGGGGGWNPCRVENGGMGW